MKFTYMDFGLFKGTQMDILWSTTTTICWSIDTFQAQVLTGCHLSSKHWKCYTVRVPWSWQLLSAHLDVFYCWVAILWHDWFYVKKMRRAVWKSPTKESRVWVCFWNNCKSNNKSECAFFKWTILRYKTENVIGFVCKNVRFWIICQEMHHLNEVMKWNPFLMGNFSSCSRDSKWYSLITFWILGR